MKNVVELSVPGIYDVIIVGAGTAGCVLANRFSEDPNLRILVLEAGTNHNEDPKVKTPGRADLNGRIISHPRGRLIGGSIAINSHAVVYPSKAWLDAWVEFGNNGCSAEEMYPYYHKFQSLIYPDLKFEEHHHLHHTKSARTNSSGPVQVSFPATLDPLSEAWVDSFDQLDYGISGSVLTGGRSIGGGIIPCAVAIGERSHSGVADLELVLYRSNLKVLEDVFVERVVFDTTNPELVVATGVQYPSHGVSHVCRAEKEVILCAGAFQSPQILELSGIGEPELLKSLEIDEVVHNAYVGENLQDHLNCGPSFEVKEGYPTSDEARNPDYVTKMRKQYELNKSGRLASGSCYTFGHSSLQIFDSKAETQSLLEYVNNFKASPDPAVTVLNLPSQKLQDGFIRRMISDRDEATATIYMAAIQRNLDQPEPKRKAILQEGNYISLIAMLCYPFS